MKNYQVNLDAVNKYRSAYFTDVADMHMLRFPVETADSTLHLLGMREEELRFIPFSSEKDYKQPIIAEVVRPGDFVIGVRQYAFYPSTSLKSHAKFQTGHVQFMPGVEDGIVRAENQKTSGKIASKGYPVTFIKPTFPEGVSAEQQDQYRRNMIAWSVLIAQFSEFPTENYNGSDPLGGKNVSDIITIGDYAIKALLGDQEAADWLKQPEHQLYCGELVYTVLHLGVYYPLNESKLSKEQLEKVKKMFADKKFVDTEEHAFLDKVPLQIADESLLPINELLGHDISDAPDGKVFGQGLVVKPFLFSDVIETFVHEYAPREELGEEIGAPLQALLLEKIKPLLLNAMGLDHVDDNDAKKQMFDQFFGQVKAAVAKPYENYEEFRQHFKPVIDKAMELSAKCEIKAFIPPHAYLIRTRDYLVDKSDTGLFGWEYVGHGIHEDLVTEVKDDKS